MSKLFFYTVVAAAIILVVFGVYWFIMKNGSRGKLDFKDIGNILEKENLIRVEAPRPGDLVRSPLSIKGIARGTWFFEASFPVVLTDANGNILAWHYAEAQGQWMTENFVPFYSTLEFLAPESSTNGYLVLKKDNPSGLPEHDDEVKFPIRFR